MSFYLCHFILLLETNFTTLFMFSNIMDRWWWRWNNDWAFEDQQGHEDDFDKGEASTSQANFMKAQTKRMEAHAKFIEDIVDKDNYDKISTNSKSRRLDKSAYTTEYKVPLYDLPCMVTGITINSMKAENPSSSPPSNTVTMAHLVGHCVEAKEAVSLGYFSGRTCARVLKKRLIASFCPSLPTDTSCTSGWMASSQNLSSPDHWRIHPQPFSSRAVLPGVPRLQDVGHWLRPCTAWEQRHLRLLRQLQSHQGEICTAVGQGHRCRSGRWNRWDRWKRWGCRGGVIMHYLTCHNSYV